MQQNDLTKDEPNKQDWISSQPLCCEDFEMIHYIFEDPKFLLLLATLWKDNDVTLLTEHFWWRLPQPVLFTIFAAKPQPASHQPTSHNPASHEPALPVGIMACPRGSISQCLRGSVSKCHRGNVSPNDCWVNNYFHFLGSNEVCSKFFGILLEKGVLS